MSEFLLPVDDDPLTQPFWEACARGELRMQRFTASGRYCWPPRPMDPASRTLEYEWVPVSGLGTVWSVAIPHPPLLPAYTDFAPYNVVVVQLDEDPALRMVGNVVAAADAPLDSIDPHSVEIGQRVRAVFSPVGDMFLPRWVPVDA
jgi:uncharacterized OB-fold protein